MRHLFCVENIDLCGSNWRDETWWKRPGHQKNDPEWQQTRSGLELRRNGRFYVQPKSGFLAKMHFNPIFLKRLISILEKGTFFFEQLFPVMARTWLESGSVCLFLGPQIQFLLYVPNFGQRLVRSLQRDRSFPTLGAIFRLFVPELWPFS